MELNGDGFVDILSGSYSRHDNDMAGLFQVLWGQKDGRFKAAEVLRGSDGKELILATDNSTEDAVIQKICTRPTAVDLDGDGVLDIVSGNFAGTFAFFKGEAIGKFSPKSTYLKSSDGKPMKVAHHSDPFLVDFDKDGDLDLFSGSASGGVSYFKNIGSKKAPQFAPAVVVLPEVEYEDAKVLGDAHVKGPQRSTRVYVDDVNGDGKLDLLVGDCVLIVAPQKGVDEATAKKALLDASEKLKKLMESPYGGVEEPSEADQKKFQDAYESIANEKAKFVHEDWTGFVWFLAQK